MLTQDQKQIILATVPVLRESGVALTTYFYQRMFTHNPELKNIFNMGNQKSGKQQTALAMAVLAYAENIADPSVLMPVVNSIGHKHTSLQITPQMYDIVGEHLIHSIMEVLELEKNDPIIDAWTQAYLQLAGLMKGHEKGIYQNRDQKANSWQGFKDFKVQAKIKESDEVTSFYLVPKDGGEVPSFESGQYISVKLFIDSLDLYQIRQYSLSCASNNKHFRISVKKEVKPNPDQNGIISNYIHDKLHVGDTIQVSMPSGVFVLQENNKNKVFISGGIGQTPLMSMLEALDGNMHDKKVIWIHGARDTNVQAFKEKVKQLTLNNSNLKVVSFYDKHQEHLSKDSYHQGVVNVGLLNDLQLNNDFEYYLCGPTLFLEKQLQDLQKLGINKEQIFFEEFGPATL
ncbi:NO-inducible flavohemoprotein [Myroides sp. LJL110]